MNMRFWVIGGEYTDTSFNQLVGGSERVMGPFLDRGTALTAWREVAEQSRSDCHVRYTIAQEPGPQAS
jgi:hypothetical protein